METSQPSGNRLQNPSKDIGITFADRDLYLDLYRPGGVYKRLILKPQCKNNRRYFDIHLTKNIPGLLVLIDFQKAFDTVEWKFLFRSLKSYNFGPTFRSWIKILYT